MTTQALERAARAITKHWYESFFFMGMKPAEPVWEQMTQDQKDYALGQARAVLMAVLPTLNRHGDEGYVYYDDLLASHTARPFPLRIGRVSFYMDAQRPTGFRLDARSVWPASGFGPTAPAT